MKTSRLARRIVRTRRIALCLAIVAVIGLELWLGESLSARLGQTSQPSAGLGWTVWNPKAPSLVRGWSGSDAIPIERSRLGFPPLVRVFRGLVEIRSEDRDHYFRDE
jgi:hypothetical protein